MMILSQALTLITDPVISDHLAVHCKIVLKKPSFQRKEISYPNLKSVDKQCFKTDIKESSLMNFDNIDNVTELIDLLQVSLSLSYSIDPL
jgi:hypothetical protein